jgi:hypothetical protein
MYEVINNIGSHFGTRTKSSSGYSGTVQIKRYEELKRICWTIDPGYLAGPSETEVSSQKPTN